MLDSEIMQLPDCNGYLKLAPRPDRLRRRFRPVEFRRRVKPFVPAERVRLEAAESGGRPEMAYRPHELRRLQGS